MRTLGPSKRRASHDKPLHSKAVETAPLHNLQHQREKDKTKHVGVDFRSSLSLRPLIESHLGLAFLSLATYVTKGLTRLRIGGIQGQLGGRKASQPQPKLPQVCILRSELLAVAKGRARSVQVKITS